MVQEIYKKVQVWIYSGDSKSNAKVLLLKMTPQRGGYFQPVTGSVEKGEILSKAATREVFEETGLTVKDNVELLGYQFCFEGKWDWYQGEVEETCFEARVESCPEVQLDPKEHDSCRWVSLDQAFDMLYYESNKEALRTLIAKRFTSP